MPTQPDHLSDAELLRRAGLWRLSAMRGMRGARKLANLHEIEVRRRFTDHVATGYPPLRTTPLRPVRRWWRLLFQKRP